MSTTTDTQRLYYGFSKDELAYPSRIDRDRWDNYVITISNGTELREHCRAIAEAENANADCIEHALGERLQRKPEQSLPGEQTSWVKMHFFNC